MRLHFLFLLLVATSVLLAQEKRKEVQVETLDVRVGAPGAPADPAAGDVLFTKAQAVSGASFQFVAAEGPFGGKTVTGAPYSAEGITDFVQVLADGTRITRRNVSKIARDGQGRTRHERTLDIIGPWASGSDAPKIITITDPVAKESYVLHEKEKSVVKFKLDEAGVFAVPDLPPSAEAGKSATATFTHAVAAPVGAAMGVAGRRVMAFRNVPDNSSVESLGRQRMEDLVVEGKRMTHTIPAGEIGNDRPLTNVFETWTSPDLQVVVRSISKDPQTGETTYRLSGVSRAEPAAALFQIPPDYTVREAPAFKKKLIEVEAK